MRERATLRDGRRRDTMIWTLFADDYVASRAATTPLRAFDVAGQRLL